MRTHQSKHKIFIKNVPVYAKNITLRQKNTLMSILLIDTFLKQWCHEIFLTFQRKCKNSHTEFGNLLLVTTKRVTTGHSLLYWCCPLVCSQMFSWFFRFCSSCQSQQLQADDPPQLFSVQLIILSVFKRPLFCCTTGLSPFVCWTLHVYGFVTLSCSSNHQAQSFLCHSGSFTISF